MASVFLKKPLIKSVRKFENLHIVCWLMKDTCWVLDLKTLGIVMVIPTVFLAFYITYKFRSVPSEFYHNLAVCSWILANSVWMIGEFFFDDTLRPYAFVFFSIGLLVLGIYYIFLRTSEAEVWSRRPELGCLSSDGFLGLLYFLSRVFLHPTRLLPTSGFNFS